MKQILQRCSLRSLLSLLFLLAMVGNAWGETVTFDPASDKSFPKDGITISVSNGTLTNGTDYRVYKSATMTISSTVGTITNIALTYTNASYDGGGWASSYQPNATSWTSPKANGEQARIKSITVTYTAANTATAPTLPASCTFTSASYDVTITNEETGATVYYTTDGTVPTASSTSFTGESTTFSIDATTTVKAMAVIDGKSNSSVTSATYTKEASIANTEATAYTTAEAIALIDANSSQLTTTDVYVKGTVSKVEKISSGAITYWLDTNTFEVYAGKGISGADFSDINDVVVGAEVIVKGKIKKWGTTYEFDSGSALVSYTAPAVSKNTATLTLGTYKSGLTTGYDDQYTVTYDGDATLVVTSSDETVAEAIIVDGSVMLSAKKAGTTTITVSAAETENYFAASKYYTLTVTDPAPAAELPFTFDGGKSDINSKTGMTQYGLSTDYTSSPKLKFDDAGDYVIINYASTARNITYKLKGNATTSATVFDVMESADGKNYTSVHSHTGTVTSTANSYTDQLKSDSRYVKFVYTTKGGNVALGAISITNEKADAGLTFGQATYYFFTTTESLNVAASSAKGSTGAITYALTEGDNSAFLIDENTGDIVCETAGTYTVTATIAETDDHKSGTATCTVRIKEPVVPNAIIVAEADGKYFAMTNTYNSGKYIESVQIVDKVGDKYVVAGEEALNAIKYAVATADGKTTIVAMNGQYLQATAAKAVSFTDDKYEWTNDGEKLTAATSSYGTLQYNTSNPRFTTYSSKSGQYAQIVSLDDVVFGTSLTISAAQYATYYNSAAAYTMPKGCTGYIWNNGLVETYTAGAVVPAAEPLVIYSEAEGKKTLVFTTTSEAKKAENALLGTDEAATTEAEGDVYYYGLAVGQGENEGKVGFYWRAEEGAAFVNGAHKAYLALSKADDVKAAFPFAETLVDAITSPLGESEGALYNLAGQRIAKMQKGINIVNGKKVALP